MTILQVQIFVLLLGAFLLGAATACLFRRAFSGPREDEVAAAAAAVSAARPLPPDTSRFERALAGDPSNAVPTPFHSFKVPVVEVQPIPAPQPQPIARQPEPPAPAPVVAEPVLTPPPPVEMPILPPAAEEPPAEEAVAELEPLAEPELPAEPEPLAEPEPAPIETVAEEEAVAPESFEAPAEAPPEHVPSYTEVASAAVNGAEAPAPSEPEPIAEEAAPEPEVTPAPEPQRQPSYTEIAAAAAEAAAVFAAQAALASPAAEEEPVPADDLTRIRYIDATVQQRLNYAGVRTFAEIAGWSDSDIARVNQTLGFYGRIKQENWIEQAKVLAQGGAAVEAAPARTPEDVAAAVAVPLAADRLHRIIGIDPETEELLVANGVTRIADIAAWTWQDVEKVEALIGKPGRVGLENWIEQARFLTRAGSPAASAPREHAPIAYAAGPATHQIEPTGLAPELSAASAPAFEAPPPPEPAVVAEPQTWLPREDEPVAYAPAPPTHEIEPPLAEPDPEPVVGAAPAPPPALEPLFEPTPAFEAAYTAGPSTHQIEPPLVLPETPPAAAEPTPEPVVEAEPAPPQTWLPREDAPVAYAPEPATHQIEPSASVPDAEVAETAEPYSEARSDNLAGLRSVRSEALRGDADPHYGGDFDDLKRIRGIGVLIERKLYSLGVTSYEQVANWTSADIERISQVLDFKGRIERENWVEQARILASGGQTEFSRRADRGEV